MATLNKPENFKTNEAHDLGQISIKSLLDFIEEQANSIEKKKGGCYWVEELALDYQAKTLDSIVCFIIEQQQKKAEPPEIREGMADFIGPLRPIWSWTKNHGGRDPRAMTTCESATYSNAFRSDYPYAMFSEQPIDAPRYIAAGSTDASSYNHDRDRNIFPTTIDREWMHL